MSNNHKDNEMILVTNSGNVNKVFSDFEQETGVLIKPNAKIDQFVRSLNKNPFEEILVKRRGDMEQDTSFKQFIPYTLIQEREEGKYLLYRRLTKGGETRLNGQLSLGVGGHSNFTLSKQNLDTLNKHQGLSFTQEEAEKYIAKNPSLIKDLNLTYSIEEQLVENGNREISEELSIKGDIEISTLGLLNDNIENVGKVHVCYLQLGRVDSKDIVEVNELENDILQIVGWYTLAELKQMVDSKENIESWSEIIINDMSKS